MPDTSKKLKCFVICPIGSEGSDIRLCSNLVLKHIITPVAKELGFQVSRADNESRPGIVTS